MRGTVLRLLVAVIILGAFACGGGSSSTSHSLTVSASPVEVERGGRSTITATLEDADGGVGSWIAKFSFRRNESGATLDTIDKVTDINGQVTATYTAGQTPGVDIVEVYFNNAAVATAQITVAGAAPVQGRLQLTVGGVSGDGTFEIVARLFNNQGEPMEDALVNFTTDHGTVDPPSATTDADGYARTTLTTTRNTTVRATSGGAYASRQVSISATDVRRVVLQAFGPALEGDAPIPNTRVIRATVYDNANRPMPGVEVNFSSNPGSVDPPSATTNANGVAETVLYSPVTSNVRATAGTFTVELRVEPIDPVAPETPSIFLSGPSFTTVAGIATLTARLRDTRDNPIPNVEITFVTDAGTLTPARSFTDLQGNAQTGLSGLSSGQSANIYAVYGTARSNTLTVSRR